MFVLISLLALAIGLVFLFILGDRSIWFCIIGVPLLLYGLLSLAALGGHSKLDDDMKQYEKALFEYEMLKNAENIPMDIANEYVKDIKKVNDLIDYSAKYCNNSYLGNFYYEEIGKLEKIPVPKSVVMTKIEF